MRVLDISGEAYAGSPQSKLALSEYRRESTITALYGFSGGGYNIQHIPSAGKPQARRGPWLGQ